MEKILMVGAGSKVDPGYDDVRIDGTLFKTYMTKQGITVLDPVIESCHGCPDLQERYSKQLQERVESGDRVVFVLQGGLSFALPSLQATQVTFPIISIPLDMVAYTAFMVPSGHAAIAGVGVELKEEGVYNTSQREKALRVAANILNFEGDSVSLVGDGDLGKLTAELEKFKISVSKNSDLVLNFDYYPFDYYPNRDNNVDKIHLWADSDERLMEEGHFDVVQTRLMSAKNTLQVKGDKNLAIYAAKILSLQREDLRVKLKEIQEKKRASYPERDLEQELREMEV